LLKDVAEVMDAVHAEEGARWIATVAASPSEYQAINGLVGRWAGGNREAVAAWLQEQPAGEMRDVAIGAFAEYLAVNEGSVAVRWALAISNPLAREERLRAVIVKWADDKPEAARQWVLQQKFSLQRQRALLEGIPKPER
jgi:hypothetical protein